MDEKAVWKVLALVCAVVMVASGIMVSVNAAYNTSNRTDDLFTSENINANNTPFSLSSNTIYVPDNYAKIQWAVDNASAGDTLIVRDGTYTENINVNKRLTIKSENGADKTIVQAAYSGDRVFEVTANYVNISGFTVKGATVGGRSHPFYSDGIYLSYADYCNISNNNCSNIDDGIFLWYSTNNSISNNECSNNIDDGIDLRDSTNNSISDNICSNNRYGISLKDSNNSIISNNNCSSNDVNGIDLWDSTNNSISNNKCSNNIAGIHLVYSTNNSISDNICSNNDGGIYLWYSNDSGISNNDCSSNNYAGISLYDSTDNSISNNNCCSNNVDGIHTEHSTDNSISNNNCTNNSWYSIFLEDSNNNVIYLNNFISSTNNVYSYNSTNIWNFPSKITYTYKGKTYTNYLGNYWDDYDGIDTNSDGIGDIPFTIDGDRDNYPIMTHFEIYELGISNSEGRQQLVEAVEELELAILNSIDYDIRHVADSYALLATAAELTPWWRELARLALDTIHAVVGTIIEVGKFLTPEGANQVLEDPSTCQQVINGVKKSKDILGGIAAFQGLAGLYRNADSYKLSFEAINTVEEVARQEYEVSGDFDRTANAAWLELWRPSTPNGLLIPLKIGAPLKEGSRSSVSRWVNGIKEVREEVRNSFDDVINEIPDPLPADYPLAETITYVKNLKQQIRGGGYRVVKFKCVEEDKEIKRHITLGMVQEGREATSLLYDAWMDDLDVQYISTLHKTGETIMHVTTYGIPATGVTKKVAKGVSDLYEVIDIIQLPSDLVNLIDKPVHPLDALQNHTVKMNNDLVHETSNLWTLAEGTLKYLQYTWEPAEDSTPAELSGELTIAGSTTVFPINTECARVLMVENPELRISVSGGGSGHGVKAVGEGAIDIGAASRDVKSKEMEMYPDLKPVVVGKDSVAIVLHPSNLVSDLTMEDASKIFSGEITNWKDVGGTDGKIRVITREGGSGTRDCFETSVMNPFDREIAGKASVKPSNGDIRATVSRDEMSIGYLSLGYVDESLKTVKIDGVEATEENVLSGDYPISRSLYIITKGAPSELEKAFIDFALSEEGQKVVEDMGYIRVTEEVTPTSPQENLHEGDISVTTVYHRVRNITDLNNPLDPNNLIFTMHPPDERTNPPYDVGKILDGPKTDNQYGYTWWKIEWDNGEVGWSAEGPFDKPTEKWLKKQIKLS